MTDYLKVTNPGIWVLLMIVLFLFAGLFVWSSSGVLETVKDGVVIVENKEATATLKDGAEAVLKSGMDVRIGDNAYTITSTRENEYGQTIGAFSADIDDGRYDARIVTDTTQPIEFLIE